LAAGTNERLRRRITILLNKMKIKQAEEGYAPRGSPAGCRGRAPGDRRTPWLVGWWAAEALPPSLAQSCLRGLNREDLWTSLFLSLRISIYTLERLQIGIN